MPGAKVETGIGSCLRVLRESLGWSQVELARAAGMSATALSRIETGRLRPPAARLRLLLGLMGFPGDSWRLLDLLMQRGFL
jgi:transcriptional regulator with XRE-family HTH domain